MEIKKYEIMEATNNKYYVVKKGREVGIYSTWEEADAQVSGFSFNDHCIVEGKNEALRVLKEDLELRLINEKLSQQELETLSFCLKYYRKEKNLKFPSIF